MNKIEVPDLVFTKAPVRCCAAAERFLVFTNSLLEHAQLLIEGGQETGEIAINQAKVVLLDRFYSERQAAPLEHRDRIEADNGALCVYGVFLHGLNRLMDLQLRKKPPVLVPTPQPPPEPVVIRERVAPPAGIWIESRDD